MNQLKQTNLEELNRTLNKFENHNCEKKSIALKKRGLSKQLCPIKSFNALNTKSIIRVTQLHTDHVTLH